MPIPPAKGKQFTKNTRANPTTVDHQPPVAAQPLRFSNAPRSPPPPVPKPVEEETDFTQLLLSRVSNFENYKETPRKPNFITEEDMADEYGEQEEYFDYPTKGIDTPQTPHFDVEVELEELETLTQTYESDATTEEDEPIHAPHSQSTQQVC